MMAGPARQPVALEIDDSEDYEDVTLLLEAEQRQKKSWGQR
jgi:hypothetical protein